VERSSWLSRKARILSILPRARKLLSAKHGKAKLENDRYYMIFENNDMIVDEAFDIEMFIDIIKALSYNQLTVQFRVIEYREDSVSNRL
jgi:hypothetical protein